jgi:hypothetical protein
MIKITNKQTGKVETYTEAAYIEKRDALFLALDNAKKALEVAKAVEIEARIAAVDFGFDQEKVKGTERIQLGNGYVAKAVKKINYGWLKNADGKVDKDKIEAALQKIEKDAGSVGELIAERLVKWSPELSITEYDKLNEKHRKIIDQVIVTTSGTPTLEIIAPKAAK